VLELRYGLGGSIHARWTKVGRTFNVTRERIRQIEKPVPQEAPELAEAQKLRRRRLTRRPRCLMSDPHPNCARRPLTPVDGHLSKKPLAKRSTFAPASHPEKAVIDSTSTLRACRV